MTIRQGERRRSRASFNRALYRILARIAEQPVYDLEWKDDLLHKIHHCRIDISGVWVAGSYARGAPDCGDLDLIIDLGPDAGVSAWTSKITRNVIGHVPDVRLYIGTPEKNSSGVAFPEAKLLWSPTAPDWQAALSQISVDPSATRYARRNDELPLRPEQLYIQDDNTLDQLLDLKENGVIEWQWIPASDIDVRPERWSDEARDFAEYIRRNRGRKSRAVMQLVIEYFEQYQTYVTWQKDWNDELWFRIGGAQVFVGRPRVQVALIDDLSCSSIVIAPHLSRRGPNGLWFLSRGVNHPLEQAFRGSKVYYLTEQQAPAIIQEFDDWRNAYSIRIFHSREEAEERANEERAEAEFEIDLEVAVAEGRDLLNLISTVDIIDIGAAYLPISEEGRLFCGESQVASVEAMLAVINGPHKGAA